MHRIPIVAFCLVMGISAPFNCVLAETQATATADACRELEIYNVEMKALIRVIRRDHWGNKNFLSAFRRAQSAWSVFRDAHLNAVYPGQPERYGSAYAMCRCIVLKELTQERIETLKKWRDDGAEGDVCAGSMKRKAP